MRKVCCNYKEKSLSYGWFTLKLYLGKTAIAENDFIIAEIDCICIIDEWPQELPLQARKLVVIVFSLTHDLGLNRFIEKSYSQRNSLQLGGKTDFDGAQA